jgi:hypothetical protein
MDFLTRASGFLEEGTPPAVERFPFADLRARLAGTREFTLQDVKQLIWAKRTTHAASLGDPTPIGRELVLPAILDHHVHQMLALQRDEPVSLRAMGHREAALRAHYRDEHLRDAMLHTLLARDLLRFPHDWYWRVDREARDYDERFGFSSMTLLDAYDTADGEQPRIVMEWGAGSGRFKQQIEHAYGSAFRCFALSDAAYVAPQALTRTLIDFPALARSLGDDDIDEETVAYALALVTLQDPSSMDTDEPKWDSEVEQDLAYDLSLFAYHLHRKAPLLKNAGSLRDPAGAMHGGKIAYPARLSKARCSSVLRACLAIAERPDAFILADTPGLVLSHMPVHVPSMLFGDFSNVDHLASDEIDASFAVRGPVFLAPGAYADFQTHVWRTLSAQGCAVDDSVRSNFGIGDRIAELLEVQRRIQSPLWLIKGPGQQTEEGGSAVPKAFVMAKDPAKVELIRSSLFDGHSLHPLPETA